MFTLNVPNTIADKLENTLVKMAPTNRFYRNSARQHTFVSYAVISGLKTMRKVNKLHCP